MSKTKLPKSSHKKRNKKRHKSEHRQLSTIGIPRKKDGNRLGLRKRVIMAEHRLARSWRRTP